MKCEKECSVRTADSVFALIPTLKGLGFPAHFLIKQHVRYCDRLCCTCKYGHVCAEGAVACNNPELEGDTTYTSDIMVCAAWTEVGQ